MNPVIRHVTRTFGTLVLFLMLGVGGQIFAKLVPDWS